jgi:ankyrin repeat protein
VTSDPTLVQERYAGRTLLHEAAAAGSLTTVQLLLRLGADPEARDGGGHTPLYSVGNECSVEGAGQVVRELVQAGAAVNACDGVQRCTALHMAARRNNVEVAATLLDCGADIEARDRAGDTPLRRAVNCNQVAVAALLLARGADLHSAGNGRTTAMKRLLQQMA